MAMLETFLQALTLQAGYNAAVVGVGAALLGFAAGAAGAFLFLRKRALVSDAIAHATLPGVGLAFIAMVAIGLDGRSLVGLMAGAAATATLGFYAVEELVRRTRLAEDAAIGAVLSVFFGLGVVLLTVIQTVSAGRQAGLSTFLLGSTAGMLLEDAVVIAAGGALTVAAIWALRRPMALVAFDQDYAASIGVDVRRIDLAMMGLIAAVTVIGLKLVGLVMIVAMLIIPATTARFWSDRVDHVALIAGALGAASAYLGAALSAALPNAPTGPIIVLTAATAFAASLLLAPKRGALAAILRRRAFQRRVHLRQGLLAVARGEPVLEPYTLRVLRAEGAMRGDGVPTEAGRALAAKAARDEARWRVAREIYRDGALPGRYDGLTPIETLLTADEIAAIDRLIGAPRLETA